MFDPTRMAVVWTLRLKGGRGGSPIVSKSIIAKPVFDRHSGSGRLVELCCRVQSRMSWMYGPQPDSASLSGGISRSPWPLAVSGHMAHVGFTSIGLRRPVERVSPQSLGPVHRPQSRTSEAVHSPFAHIIKAHKAPDPESPQSPICCH